MYRWGFDGTKIKFEKCQPFKLSQFGFFVCTIWYNQLLLQFKKDSFHTLLTCWEYKENMYSMTGNY